MYFGKIVLNYEILKTNFLKISTYSLDCVEKVLASLSKMYLNELEIELTHISKNLKTIFQNFYIIRKPSKIQKNSFLHHSSPKKSFFFRQKQPFWEGKTAQKIGVRILIYQPPPEEEIGMRHRSKNLVIGILAWSSPLSHLKKLKFFSIIFFQERLCI